MINKIHLVFMGGLTYIPAGWQGRSEFSILLTY